MPFYRTPDGKGSMHLNFGGRQKRAPAQCRARRLEADSAAVGEACLRPASKLCDWPIATRDGRTLATCDTPLCELHAINVGKDRDHCPRHAQLGQRPPSVPSAT